MSASDSFRINNLPPYLLGSLAQSVVEARNRGRDVIDLSKVNPDLPPSETAVDKLLQSILQARSHRYGASRGIRRLREAASSWYKSRYQVELDPEKEVIATLGSKEGLAHLLLSTCSPGENVAVLTPSYPVHTAAVFIAGASFIGIPLFKCFDDAEAAGYFLTKENTDDFFRRLERIFGATWPKPRFLILNFPHNPTASVCSRDFFQRLVDFALATGCYLIHDFAYATICYQDYTAPSLMEVDGARDVAVEFFSLSKCYGVPGWRVGFCVGNEELVDSLHRIKKLFGLWRLSASPACCSSSARGRWRLFGKFLGDLPRTPGNFSRRSARFGMAGAGAESRAFCLGSHAGELQRDRQCCLCQSTARALRCRSLSWRWI